MNPLESEEFIDPVSTVIGLFCTWALDYRLFNAFIAGHEGIDRIRKMDIPPPPAEIMEIFADSGKIEIPLDTIRRFIPNACSCCPDMTSEFSDLSVGVLEGNPAWNTLIIRTEKGEKLAGDAQSKGYLVVERMPEENMRHLLYAAANKKKRAFLKLKSQGLLNSSDPGKRSCFRISDPILKKICSENYLAQVCTKD